MKRNIILAVVVIAALSLAGAGGVFATWSDSEVSMGNEIITGSVDLKVNDADDEPYGTGVPTKVTIDCMVPCRWYGPKYVDLWNAGVCEFPSAAYVHFKDACCGNAPPKEGSGYPDVNITPAAMKPEPELVAEYGGKVDCTEVPGIGRTGDDCSMLSHIEIMIFNSDTGELLVGPVLLIDILCDEIYICDLNPCDPVTIEMWFHLIQETEEMYGHNFFLSPEELGLVPDDPGYDEALLHWTKFNDWPSWAMMRDTVVFNMEFDLLLLPPPGPLPPIPIVGPE